MLEDAESVRGTAEDLDPATLSAIVELLVGARRVYVFGARGSFGLALILMMRFRPEGLLPASRVQLEMHEHDEAALKGAA